MKLTRCSILAVVGAAFLISSSWAAEVPSAIRAFLVKKGRTDLIKRYEQIKIVSPQAFLDEFGSNQPKYLNGGMFGLVFREKKTGDVVKFSHAITLDSKMKLDPDRSTLKKLQLDSAWADFSGFVEMKDIQLYQTYKDFGEKFGFGGLPVVEETLGDLLWAAYSSNEVEFVQAISQDGLAYRRKYYEGITLEELLVQERKGADLSAKYKINKDSDMTEIWSQVATLMKTAEKMLMETGMTIDILSPGNFLVTRDGNGDGTTLKVFAFDRGLVHPSKETFEHYRRLPEAPFSEDISVVTRWPLMPEHIVSSQAWDLTIDQGVQFLKAYHSEMSACEAIRRFARIPEWPIAQAPQLQQFEKIRESGTEKVRQKYCSESEESKSSIKTSIPE